MISREVKRGLAVLAASLLVMEALASLFFALSPGFERSRKVLAGLAPPESVSQRCIPQAYLLYIPTPGYSDEAGVQHNAQGWRGRAVALDKTRGIARVLCLGGSTTYGWGVAEADRTFPSYLEQVLSERLPKGVKGVEVINGGLPSGTSAEMLTHYLFKFHYYRPDLVIIHAGSNDASAMIAPWYNPDYSHFRRQLRAVEPLPRAGRLLLRSRLAALFILLITHGPRPDEMFYTYDGPPPPASWYPAGEGGRTALAKIPPGELAFRHNLEALLDALRRDGAKVLLVPERLNPAAKDDYAAEHAFMEGVLREAAAKSRAAYAPFPASVVSAGNWLDLGHTNAAGNLEIARYLAPFAAKLLWGGRASAP